MADWTEPDAPVRFGAHRREPLTRRQRLATAGAAAGPVVALLMILAPFALPAGYTVGEVVGAAVVYGGLLGLAAGFVYVDRVHARRCPRCGGAHERRAGACPRCGYDLVARPRYACEQRHAVYAGPGVCACGLRLRPLEVARGVRREIVVVAAAGAVVLAALVAVGLLLRFVS